MTVGKRRQQQQRRDKVFHGRKKKVKDHVLGRKCQVFM